MFKGGGVSLLLIGRSEFSLLLKDPVYFSLEHAHRKAVGCSVGAFGK